MPLRLRVQSWRRQARPRQPSRPLRDQQISKQIVVPLWHRDRLESPARDLVSTADRPGQVGGVPPERPPTATALPARPQPRSPTSRRTFFAVEVPTAGSDAQGKSEQCKITCNLSPDGATSARTGHNCPVQLKVADSGLARLPIVRSSRTVGPRVVQLYLAESRRRGLAPPARSTSPGTRRRGHGSEVISVP